MSRGGKREGAGRPPAPPRPKPVSWRPRTQAVRDRYIELGGARWLERTIAETMPSPRPVAVRVSVETG